MDEGGGNELTSAHGSGPTLPPYSWRMFPSLLIEAVHTKDGSLIAVGLILLLTLLRP